MHVTEESFVSALVLTGIRRPNNTLQSVNDSGVYMDDWPETVTFNHRTFSLYEVTSGNDGHSHNVEEARYV